MGRTVPATAPVTAPPKRRLPEDDLALSLLASGDRRGAVGVLMATHEETVFAYCVRMLRDRELAEDVAQQVFTEAHRDIGRFRGESSVRTWLIGIAHHRCGDAIKSRTRRSSKIELSPDAVTDHVDPTSTQTEQLERARLVAALEDCLEELPHDIRETILLRFLSDMTYEEMSKLQGRKADTLCVRVARALPTLKDCLERKGWRHG
jgi:RNA polymerase sigma-70 factor, ECF subfamily